jgi:hypothetical protein
VDWLKAQSQETGVQIPETWLFLHYYEALCVLFRVENSLRTLVYVVLKNTQGLKWGEVSLATDEAEQTTIAAVAKKRIAQGQAYGYLGYTINSPMMHLTSGELVRLMTSDALWPLFKRYFNAAKHVVSLKLEEIGIIRNSLAHFRPLTPDDVEVVKQNANQVLPAIEDTLSNIVSEGQRVPTNSNDGWYLNLRSLGGQYTQIVFSQSRDAAWLMLSLQFTSPMLAMFPEKPETYVYYTVLALNPVGLLNLYPVILERVTCVFLESPYTPIPASFKPSIATQVRLVFGRDSLEKHHLALKSELETILAEIDKEADLIKEDNLAKGRLVHMASASAHKRTYQAGEYWSFSPDHIAQPLSRSDLAEYWGTMAFTPRGFVSDTDRFPWMPVAVSRQRAPF